VKEINEFNCSSVVSHAHQSPAWDDPQEIRMANLNPPLIRKEQCKGLKRRLTVRPAYLFRSHD
jgi:hypothetical protein